MISNCLFWAIKQLWQHGGYVAFRRTRQTVLGLRGWWPHVLWSPDLETWHSFVPHEEIEAKSTMALLFRGYVLEGDAETMNLPEALGFSSR